MSAHPVPGVHLVRLARSRAYLLEGETPADGLTLVDCGLPGSRGAIETAIRRVHRDPAELRRVLITHGHPDHAGSARELAAAGAMIYMHPADLDAVRRGLPHFARNPSRNAFFHAATPPIDAATPLKDDDEFPVLGGLRVVHVPGHTPGSVCLFAPRSGTLFVGDALAARGGKVGFASRIFSGDPAAARRAVRRLAMLDVRTIMFGHYPPITDGAAAILADLARRADEESGPHAAQRGTDRGDTARPGS